MRFLKSIAITAITLFILGCSAHRLSISEDGSESTIYAIDETAMFNLVYSSIQEVFPQEKISVITVPVRGYITKFLAPPLHVDWFTQKVLIHRATGTTKMGQKASGYWIEVSGSGSSFLQGQLKNKEVYETILSHLEGVAEKHRVTNIIKAPYIVPQENFYVRGADTLEGEGERVIVKPQTTGGTSQSKAQQLRDIHQLHVDGVLSDKEYEAAKQKVLSGY